MGNALSKSGSDNAASATKSSDNESSAKAQTARTEGNQQNDVGDNVHRAAPDSPTLNYTKAQRMTNYIGSKMKVGLLTNFALALESQAEPVKLKLYEIKHQKFLQYIVYGQQDEAETILKKCNDASLNTQWILNAKQDITDYSGRTFKCSAYEYAYWAKDTHMCRMLERHMDENTKAAMLEKVTAIDTVGLMYEQRGHVVEHSKHFDMTPLRTALKNYVNGYDAWDAANNYDAMKAAWMLVGLAQRDLPVHVINEYCHPDRSFHPLPAFNENKLPRILTYYNFNTALDVPLLPLGISGSSGLGVDFAVFRGPWPPRRVPWCMVPGAVALDLEAVSRLDEVRTVDLTQSRENLKPIELGHGLGMLH